MARIARVVVPGLPHHVTQRGNRRQDIFLCEEDYQKYLEIMADSCRKNNVPIWAYCLMPNHVHLVAVPERESALGQAIGEAHRKYSRQLNARQNWSGHLFQARYASFVMDERHFLLATRYIELNPVRARLAPEPSRWKWSSASAHLSGRDNDIVKVGPVLDHFPNWAEFLDAEEEEGASRAFRIHENSGRPLGDRGFVESLEKKLGRVLLPRKRGPKKGDPRR